MSRKGDTEDRGAGIRAVDGWFSVSKLHFESLVRVAPFALWIALLATQPFAAQLDSLGIDPGWGYAVRTTAVAMLLALLWSRYAELRPATALRFAPLFEAVLVGLVVFLVWITVGPLFRSGTIDDHLLVLRPDGTLDPAWVTLRMVGTALVVPIIEELFWRSYLMRRLESPDFLQPAPRATPWWAVFVSSAVFALEHREYVAGLIAGIAYAALYRRESDLRLAVVAHAVTNAALGAYVLIGARYEFW